MTIVRALVLVCWPVASVAQAPPGTPSPSDRFPARTTVVGTLNFAATASPWDPRSPGRTAVSAGGPAAAALRTPGGAFVASLVLPGSGQAALGLRRWIGYGALEVALWAVHLEAAADVRRLSTAYRDLAWEVARVPTGPGSRRDGSWGYYETVGRYLESGAFDANPNQPGVQPELDETTYNGSIWALARGIFLGPGTVDPTSDAYGEALAYYERQAAGPDFLWSWTGQGAALDQYRGLINEADAEARLRSTTLGLVLANHMVSAVDAFVVARLRAAGGVRLESTLEPGPGPTRWHVGLRIPVPD